MIIYVLCMMYVYIATLYLLAMRYIYACIYVCVTVCIMYNITYLLLLLSDVVNNIQDGYIPRGFSIQTSVDKMKTFLREVFTR